MFTGIVEAVGRVGALTALEGGRRLRLTAPFASELAVDESVGKLVEEMDGKGVLDNTLVLYGSASSAFHLSRNYPLILSGGKNMGYWPEKPQGGPWLGGTEPWQRDVSHEDIPLSNLFVTMLQRLGIETDSFADSTGTVSDV